MNSDLSFGRRAVLDLAAASATATLAASPSRALAKDRGGIKAIAFDGFAVFDPRPVGELAEKLYPGNGATLMNAWRTRQFEYTWLRTLMDRYEDFWQITSDALTFAAKLLKLEMTTETRGLLMQSVLEMRAWPEAPSALKELKQRGLELVFLANPSASMLDGWIKNSGLEGIFGKHLSTDLVRAFKPDPRAYQLGVNVLGLERDEIAFAAFGGWDAAGAKAFGYPTFWVNRANTPTEGLGFEPDGMGTDLQSLAKFVAEWSPRQPRSGSLRT